MIQKIFESQMIRQGWLRLVVCPRRGSRVNRLQRTALRAAAIMQNDRLDVRTEKRTIDEKLNTQEVRHDRNHSN